MLSGVKICAESGDIKGLHYIFVDCLDVDPTFEKYKSDYDYCKNISGFLEPYQELTPFTFDKNNWNMEYWQHLKTDLTKNFSDKRFQHMIQVASVVNADKIARLIKERNAANTPNIQQVNKPNVIHERMQNNTVMPQSSASTYDQSQILEAQRRLEEENRAAEMAIQEQEKRRREAMAACTKEEADASKKAIGVVAAVAAAAIITVAVLIIK